MTDEKPALELTDIQGLVMRAYPDLDAAAYLLLRIDDSARTRTWLVNALDASAGEGLRVTSGHERPKVAAVNLAFTYPGLAKLGLNHESLLEFPDAFQEGMAGRQRLTIDFGVNDPKNWEWGDHRTAPGGDAGELHILLLLFARDPQTLDNLYARHSKEFSRAGLHELKKLDALPESLRVDRKEHFGFVDGIGQPVIGGTKRASEIPPGMAWNVCQPGEFLLGYPDEYTNYRHQHTLAFSPTVAAAADPKDILPTTRQEFVEIMLNGKKSMRGRRDLGLNGTFLVFRQLRQYVYEFWAYLQEQTKDRSEMVKLAAKLVGRWPSGVPLVSSADKDRPELTKQMDLDQFLYFTDDPHAYGCPFGSHIRRNNPRDDALSPLRGRGRGDPLVALRIIKRHRIIRRGRLYGKPLAASFQPEDFLNSEESRRGEERGLHFLCLNANLSRQFEFVQSSWMQFPKFAGLYEDSDAVTGQPYPYGKDPSGTFTTQAYPVSRRTRGLRQFVTTSGGAYFFLPGIRALRYLSRLE